MSPPQLFMMPSTSAPHHVSTFHPASTLPLPAILSSPCSPIPSHAGAVSHRVARLAHHRALSLQAPPPSALAPPPLPIRERILPHLPPSLQALSPFSPPPRRDARAAAAGTSGSWASGSRSGPPSPRTSTPAHAPPGPRTPAAGRCADVMERRASPHIIAFAPRRARSQPRRA